jgi:ABC-type transport system involved in cytochrome c biogenesis permease component
MEGKMTGKVKWAGIGILLVLAAAFIIGLLGGMSDYISIQWVIVISGIAVLIGLVLGVSAIVHFGRKRGIKGILIGFLILLVLVPLVFAGTCALSIGGDFVRRLFVK